MRRLAETPSTSQKRKYEAYEEPRSGSAVDAEEGSRGGYSGSEYERTPTKRLKSSGTFENIGKRKDGARTGNGPSDRVDVKRKKFQR
jgi:hypothetical protein